MSDLAINETSASTSVANLDAKLEVVVLAVSDVDTRSESDKPTSTGRPGTPSTWCTSSQAKRRLSERRRAIVIVASMASEVGQKGCNVQITRPF
jgi:hypothetical protein